MSETNYNLVFEGKVEPGQEQTTVRATLDGLFEFAADEQELLFSGQPVVLGESLDAATANSFMQALAAEGVVTHLVAVSDAAGATQQKRVGQRRSAVARRAAVRSGAIMPDRRQGPKRRR